MTKLPRKIIKLSILGITILVILFCLYCIFIKSSTSFYNDSANKIWSHRGLSICLEENSLESINAAFLSGFKGVEIDIWYNNEEDCFEVKHDNIKNDDF